MKWCKKFDKIYSRVNKRCYSSEVKYERFLNLIFSQFSRYGYGQQETKVSHIKKQMLKYYYIFVC